MLRAAHAQTGLAVLGHDDLEAPALEPAGQEIPDLLMVLDQQNLYSAWAVSGLNWRAVSRGGATP
jgi:hypothetical protein